MDSETVEYDGLVVHVFCEMIENGSYTTSCEIWENAAIVRDSRSLGHNPSAPVDAKAVAFGWIRRWIDSIF